VILRVYLLLAAVGFIVNWLSGIDVRRGPGLPPSFLVTAFLVWRVSRGGRISRVLLIIGNAASCVVAALAVARQWDVAVVALIVVSAAQVALLVSPPVYGRTRPAPVPVRMRSWAQLVRRPPAWLLPCGLLAGVLVTLALLGNVDWVQIQGCMPAASDGCTALVRGYPLRWQSAYQSIPVIFEGGLLKDCVQWALVSTSFLYLGWCWLTAPADRSE
jgi:hypothetical protein